MPSTIEISGVYTPPEAPVLRFDATPSRESSHSEGKAQMTFDATIPSSVESYDGEEAGGVILYHRYGKNSTRYYDLTDKQQESLTEYYNDLRQRIMPAGATLFQVHFLNQTASYRNKEGDMVRVYLKDLRNDPDSDTQIQRSLRSAEMVVSKEIYHGSVRGHAFRHDEKGSAGGIRALSIEPRASFEDPKVVEQQVLGAVPQQGHRDAAERIQRAKQLINEEKGALAKQIGELDQHIQAINEVLTQGNNAELLASWKDAMARAEEHEMAAPPKTQQIKGLLKLEEKRDNLMEQREAAQELKAKWDRVDIYAVYTALAHLPKELTEKNVREAAREVYKQVLEENPSSRGYAVDVGGLLFSALPGASSRVAYLAYCREMGIKMRQDCLEDHLIAAVMEEGSARGLLEEMHSKHRELKKRDSRSEEHREVAEQLSKLQIMEAQAILSRSGERLGEIQKCQKACRQELLSENIQEGFISNMTRRIEALDGGEDISEDEEVVFE